ncbi:hypothetical protein EYF80_037759 [Liparis tanakae]|uniref:Uncharacterized protein n=1 Tax=Liparis tanakae TaxID=230148 RepID=A0A4Z2GH30_9TELE|nr:hypothetical protein EYF80_037759 [Liparis tanakae]
MLFLLAAHGDSDDLQQLLVRRPRAQDVSQRHLVVPEQTHLRDRGEGIEGQRAPLCSARPVRKSGRSLTLRFPSAVIRRRLQEPQKCSDMEVGPPLPDEVQHLLKDSRAAVTTPVNSENGAFSVVRPHKKKTTTNKQAFTKGGPPHFSPPRLLDHTVQHKRVFPAAVNISCVNRVRTRHGNGHSPSKGMYSMKRTSRGFFSVSATKSSSSSSLRPRITTQFTCRGRQRATAGPRVRGLVKTGFSMLRAMRNRDESHPADEEAAP